LPEKLVIKRYERWKSDIRSKEELIEYEEDEHEQVKKQMFISEKSRYIRSCEERKTEVSSEMKNPIPKMQVC